MMWIWQSAWTEVTDISIFRQKSEILGVKQLRNALVYQAENIWANNLHKTERRKHFLATQHHSDFSQLHFNDIVPVLLESWRDALATACFGHACCLSSGNVVLTPTLTNNSSPLKGTHDQKQTSTLLLYDFIHTFMQQLTLVTYW